MKHRRLRSKILATCLALLMCVGQAENFSLSAALADQTDIAQSREDAAISDIPASETEEGFVMPSSEPGSEDTETEAEVEAMETEALEDEALEDEDLDAEAEALEAEAEEAPALKAENESMASRGIVMLQSLQDTTIPFVASPSDEGAEIAIESETEKEYSFTIDEDGFVPGSYVLSLDLVSGVNFSFSCRVADVDSSEQQQYGASYVDCYERGYYDENNEYISMGHTTHWDVYFALNNPGTYQFAISNAYCENDTNTLSAKVYKTIDPPSFGYTEEQFSEAFDLTFTNIPQGCEVYYYINDYSQHHWEEQGNNYVLYDPLHPVRINTQCDVSAYCQKTVGDDVLRSETTYMYYSPDIENAVCSVSYPDNIIASGDFITFSTEDPTLIQS